MNRFRKALEYTPNLLPAGRDCVAGAAVGTLFILLFSRLRLALGASTDVMIASLLSVTLGLLVCNALIGRAGKLVVCLACGLLGSWAFLQPVALALGMDSVHQFTLEQLQNPIFQYGIVQIIVLASLFPFAVGASAILSQPDLRRGSFVFGLAGSLFTVPLLLSVMLSPLAVQWLAIGSLVVIGGAQFFFRQNKSVAIEAIGEFSGSAAFNTALFTTCLGGAFAIVCFVGQQLTLDTLAAEFALVAGIGAGVALSIWLKFQAPASRRWLALAIWGALIALAYPTLTYLALSETVWVSNTLLLLASRSLILVVLTIPIGMLVASRTAGEQGLTSHTVVLFACFSAGCAISVWSGISPTVAVLALVIVATLSSLLALTIIRGFLQTRFQYLRLTGALTLVVIGCLFIGRFDPARSEKVLFTGNTYAAFRGGVDWSLLQWLDDGRLVDQKSNLNGRWSLWKQRGQQAVVRENGLVSETKSNNPTACPLSASEVLPSLFPLVAHPTAEHVLVVGVHGSTLQTCESFPLRTITVIEQSDFFEAKREWISSQLAGAEDFQFVQADFQLGLKARHTQPYDVIIAPQAMAATTGGAAQLTEEFYRSISSNLAENGVFCQRLAFYDLGPEYVRSLTTTLKEVFPQVVIVESIPGELLFVATHQADSLITEGLVARLQLPQTRQILSSMGWDWSIPASRGTLDNERVEKWIADASSALSVRNLDSIYRLPAEIARWEMKSQQTRQSLAKHAMSLGGYLGEGDESLDIQQRLEDLQLAQSILNNHPDDIWGYRAALKKQLTERPRSKIMQVKHEGLKRRLHPDDQRRKDYLQTLGALAKTKQPTIEMVDYLIQYMHPFDPLLGPFVSNEAIHQLERVDAATESAQYFALLYSIYFSTAADKSVRNVCRATNLLCENPEIVADDAERWDQLNGLVEIFRHRWQLRFHDQRNQSDYETIDTERSIAALKSAVAEMELLAADAGLSSADWDARKKIIDESLVRPLRLHRSQQLRRTPVQR